MTERWRLKGDPRRWQAEALELWMSSERGIANVVTGAGKTRFAQMCIAEFLNKHPNGRIVLIVPTLALLDQWCVDLEDDLGVSEQEVALYSGRRRPADANRFNLMVLNTARSAAPKLTAESDPALLIVDECHRAGTPVNSKALKGGYRAALGLSATPVREYDHGLEELLVPALGEVFYSYDYDDARRDGVIAEFALVNVAIPLTKSEEERYDSLNARVARAARAFEEGKENDSKLTRLLRERSSVSGGARLRVPASIKLADRYRGSRMVIFHEQIEAAEEIVELLQERGHSATIYHSRIGGPLRRDNLRLFRQGAFRILVSCRALDEGVNIPEAEVGLIASSTASSRQRIQRLGRVLRPAKGKKSATVVTLYATEIEEERLRVEASTLDSASSVSWQKAGLPSA